MSQDTDITEVSDHRQLTIGLPTPPDPVLHVVKGNPTDEEVAALAVVLAGAGGGHAEPGPQEFNPWGHPVDKLRYDVSSWQRVTLLERTHMRR
jgi:hypothetical protein